MLVRWVGFDDALYEFDALVDGAGEEIAGRLDVLDAARPGCGLRRKPVSNGPTLRRVIASLGSLTRPKTASYGGWSDRARPKRLSPVN